MMPPSNHAMPGHAHTRAPEPTASEHGLAEIFDRAVSLQAEGHLEEALVCYRRIVALAPATAAAHHNMGIIHFGRTDWRKAMVRFKKALDLQPDFTDAAFNLAASLQQCGEYEKAILIYQLTLDLPPEMAEACHGQGVCHMNLNAPREAIHAFRRAVDLAPRNARFWFDLAEAYFSIRDMQGVLDSYGKAIALNPDWAAAHYNLAVALRMEERLEEALDHLRQAIGIDPDYAKPLPMMFRLAQHTCDWELADSVSRRLDRITDDELRHGLRTTEPPMTSIRRQADVRRNLAVSRSWSQQLHRQTEAVQYPTRLGIPEAADRRIRVGYLSGDFKDHAVAHQIRGLFENHDRRHFEIFGYACNADNGTPYRRKLATACDHFRDVHAASNLSVARQIHTDGIQILIDMSGHSRDNRLGIAALRPAPVQVSYLGFLASTGADFIDYAIADTIVVPEEDAPFYTENLAYLPNCYQANDDQMPIARSEYGRGHWHLPEKAFVFCCFNQPYKIDADLFATWMSILREVEHGVLWLVKRSPLAQERLRKAARHAGIDPNRLIFTGFVPLDQNLARLQLADLVLDTLIYNGGATTSNALWAGVPVLTSLGNHWVSRMSASALQAVELPELITPDREAYGRKAVELVRDPPRLADIRLRLWKNRTNTPMFDTPRFTRDMEKAFVHMWHRHVRGMAPSTFKVKP